MMKWSCLVLMVGCASLTTPVPPRSQGDSVHGTDQPSMYCQNFPQNCAPDQQPRAYREKKNQEALAITSKPQPESRPKVVQVQHVQQDRSSVAEPETAEKTYPDTPEGNLQRQLDEDFAHLPPRAAAILSRRWQAYIPILNRAQANGEDKADDFLAWQERFRALNRIYEQQPHLYMISADIGSPGDFKGCRGPEPKRSAGADVPATAKEANDRYMECRREGKGDLTCDRRARGYGNVGMARWVICEKYHHALKVSRRR